MRGRDTMSQELTEMLQEKAREPAKQKSERLIIRWLDDGENTDDNIPNTADEKNPQRLMQN